MELKRWSSNQKLEYWKSIENYPNYMVSSLGRVKSLKRKVSNGKGFRIVEEKILKPSFNRGGYLLVNLYANGKIKAFLVHRLVALAFIPNPKNKPCIDHIDTNPLNSNVKNLRWCTHKENCNNPLTKKKKQGEKNPMWNKPAPNRRKVKCMETGDIFNSVTEACEWCGMKTHANITMCCQGKRKSSGKHPVTKEKLHWEYVDEVELDLNLLNIDNIKISL